MRLVGRPRRMHVHEWNAGEAAEEARRRSARHVHASMDTEGSGSMDFMEGEWRKARGSRIGWACTGMTEHGLERWVWSEHGNGYQSMPGPRVLVAREPSQESGVMM